jgi:3-oxoacyl-[acyl-carrier-protein] synthase II
MPLSPDRLAITGIGVVSPYGVGRERFWEGIRHGRSATRAIDAFDASSYACRVAAPLPPVSLDDAPMVEGDVEDEVRVASMQKGSGLPLSDRADPRRYSRTALAAVIAAREAWADAGLQLGEPGAGVIVGTGSGGIDIGEDQYREFFADGWKRVTPYAIPVSICGMVSSEVSIALRLHGIIVFLYFGCFC